MALVRADEASRKKVKDKTRKIIILTVASAAVASLLALLEDIEEDDGSDDNEPKPKQRRCSRRIFAVRRAYYDCIQQDLLRPDALFGKDFHLFFRLSRPRVQMILERLGNSEDPFYETFRVDKFGRVGPCVEVKVLLPLAALAYGVAPYSLCYYFQVSNPMARECFKHFLLSMEREYGDEFLRLPTAADLRNITALHSGIHGVEGMLGSRIVWQLHGRTVQYNGRAVSEVE